MVCHVADKLAMLAGKNASLEDLKKEVEAEFFPLNSDHELSAPVLIGDAEYIIAPASALAADSRCDAIQNTGTIKTSRIKL
jgi:hypothetical protein